MKQKGTSNGVSFFETFAASVTTATGSTGAFVIAFGFVIVWGITGPFFHYSDSWQMIINTSTTIITFLMVFLIQKAQNKDSMAIQLKLNELLAAHESASNTMVSVEEMSEEELKVLQKYYSRLSIRSKRDTDHHQSHSIDEIKQEIVKKDEEKKK